MSDSDEEVLKEKRVVSNPISDWGKGRDFARYALRSFGIALLLWGVVLSVVHFFKKLNSNADLMALVIESIVKSAQVVFLSLVGAVTGPFWVLTSYSGYDFLYFLGMFALATVLFGAGCKFRKRWWGISLGIAGVFLWVFVGLMVIGQGA
jgi:hypothetical protein